MKRNGTNRRLWGQKVGWDWVGAYRILADFKEKIEFQNLVSPLGGREKKLKKIECLAMSACSDYT